MHLQWANGPNIPFWPNDAINIMLADKDRGKLVEWHNLNHKGALPGSNILMAVVVGNVSTRYCFLVVVLCCFSEHEATTISQDLLLDRFESMSDQDIQTEVLQKLRASFPGKSILQRICMHSKYFLFMYLGRPGCSRSRSFSRNEMA